MHSPKEWIPLLFGAIPVICAILAFRGFRGREHGVDLGTTYSVVGVKRGDQIVIVPDSKGNLLTPSIVSFLPNNIHLVGNEAIDYRSIDSKQTIFNAKRFIGRSFVDPVVQEEIPQYDFEVSFTNMTQDVCFNVMMNGEPKCVSPVAIGSYIVQHLKSIVAGYLGHEQVNAAVIAVPAAFNSVQRAATVEVFKMAGLKVLRILDEPSCAAIAYGLHEKKGVQFVLVFDFGGGTLDVSLLYIKNSAVEVIGTAGDNHLGGEDIDVLIAHDLSQKFEKQLGFVLHDHHEKRDPEKMDMFPCTASGIRTIAEQLKRQLSNSMESIASCTHNGKVFQESMTRKEMEDLCEPLFSRILKPVHQVLQESHMTPENINEIVLVGGSSRIPWVKSQLEKVFGRPPHNHIDPDIAVAYGAAAVH